MQKILDIHPLLLIYCCTLDCVQSVIKEMEREIYHDFRSGKSLAAHRFQTDHPRFERSVRGKGVSVRGLRYKNQRSRGKAVRRKKRTCFLRAHHARAWRHVRH